MSNPCSMDIAVLVVNRDNLGEYLHKALRKACDSREAHQVWNLIDVYIHGEIEDRRVAWCVYLDYVWGGLQNINENYTYQGVLKQSAEQLQYGNYYRTTLRNLIALLSDDDLTGMGSYLYE